MTPERLAARLAELEKRLQAIERVENVAFIESIKRNTSGALTLEPGASSAGTAIAVRNAADVGSETVARPYAGVVTLYDGQGNSYRVGYYA